MRRTVLWLGTLGLAAGVPSTILFTESANVRNEQILEYQYLRAAKFLTDSNMLERNPYTNPYRIFDEDGIIRFNDCKDMRNQHTFEVYEFEGERHLRTLNDFEYGTRDVATPAELDRICQS